MVKQFEITLPRFPRGMHLITDIVEREIKEFVGAGTVNFFLKHSSAGICLNENADPSVRADLNAFFNEIVPEDSQYFTHTLEGPDDMPAHIKSVLTGNSITIPMTNGRLNLGTWQGLYLCEFRNYGGARKLLITVHV